MIPLKEKLAKNWIKKVHAEQSEASQTLLEQAYVEGFNRAKALYVDYAERHLTKPDLKPGDHFRKDFELIGEFPRYK